MDSSADRPVQDLKGSVDKRDALELGRYCYFSLRLILLLKKLGIRGAHQDAGSKLEPSAEDHEWIRQQLLRIEPVAEKGTARAGKWLEEYLLKERKKEKSYDFAEIEREHGAKLPEDYKKFIQKMGSKVFRNVDGEEGYNVRVLLPEDLDFESFQGRINEEVEAESGEDGVVFAETELGDLFCFKKAGEPNNWEVWRYEHEMDDFELYARDFEACIRAWAGE